MQQHRHVVATGGVHQRVEAAKLTGQGVNGPGGGLGPGHVAEL